VERVVVIEVDDVCERRGREVASRSEGDEDVNVETAAQIVWRAGGVNLTL